MGNPWFYNRIWANPNWFYNQLGFGNPAYGQALCKSHDSCIKHSKSEFKEIILS
ncbi:hypothetical protein KP509_02G114600 [Ceratopteris richardii]|uniref:Uncharacterized protein n=1 Tax=Ceratopteris richardii TaxID=49495 RepID=A0A8T2V9W3_CERRI|nr:hypothetical protein KP509_02G114600 [Ceratopteris richardii]